jgi:hypothetical protein
MRPVGGFRLVGAVAAGVRVRIIPVGSGSTPQRVEPADQGGVQGPVRQCVGGEWLVGILDRFAFGLGGDSAAEFVSGGEGEVEALEVAGSFWS